MDIRSMFNPVAVFFALGGTWTATLTSHILHQRKTAAADHATIVIPLPNEGANPNYRGRQIKSIDLFYSITTDVMTIVTPRLYLETLQVDGTAASAALVATTCDHTAAQRLAVGNHAITLTVTDPTLTEGDEQYHVELYIHGTATGVFDYKGCRVNFQ